MPKRLLVVDDEEMNRDLLAEAGCCSAPDSKW